MIRRMYLKELEPNYTSEPRRFHAVETVCMTDRHAEPVIVLTEEKLRECLIAFYRDNSSNRVSDCVANSVTQEWTDRWLKENLEK